MLYTSARLDLPIPPDSLLVVCLCAAWCDTCAEYQSKLAQFAQQFPEVTCVWLDIEEDDHRLPSTMDIENFPTIHIENAEGVLFFGVLLPHIEHLERLLSHLPSETQVDPIVRFRTL